LCGQKIGEVDTLLNRKISHYSMPDFFTYAGGDNEHDNVILKCNALHQDERFLEIVFVPSPVKEIDRLVQKVKILCVEVCG
jgi:hypothetical protein